MHRFAIAAVALFWLTVLAGPAGADTALQRATKDRPDEVLGPSIHIVYAVPSDGVDRALDTNGVLDEAVADWNGWMESHAGTQFRIDSYHGLPDVTFARLPSTGAQLAGWNTPCPCLGQELGTVLGPLSSKPNTIFVVYYDGPPRVEPGTNFFPCYEEGPTGSGGFTEILGLPLGDVGGAYCYSDPRSYKDIAVLASLIHELSYPAPCAPHYHNGGVSDSPLDLLNAVPVTSGWPATVDDAVLDVNHDDYFGPPGDDHVPPGCPNLADSPFLVWHPFYKLSVVVHGSGVVAAFDGAASAPPLFCESGCDRNLTLESASRLTLVPSASTGWRFAGWSSAACAGHAHCRLVVTDNATVVARFVRRPKRR